MIQKSSQLVILRIVSIIEHDQYIMNTMDLVIQILEPCIVESVMLILSNIAQRQQFFS